MKVAAKQTPKIAIIGAGIAGLSAGIMLRKHGYTVEIFEAADTVRGLGAGMGLASNAIKAFAYLNLAEEVKAISNKLTGFEVCDEQFNPLFAIDTERIKASFQADNYAVHRSDLHRLLQSKIPAKHLHTGKTLSGLKQDNNGVDLCFSDQSSARFDYVIGADGVSSAVRQSCLPQAKPRYSGYWCWRGVVNYQLDNPQVSKAIWGRHGRFGYTPLTRNRIYWFACLNTSINDAVKQFGLSDLKKRFQPYHPFVQELLNRSEDKELISAPVVDIAPLSQFHFKRVLLLGDAAHAATPNMGQGACMAVEDVAVLQDELQHKDFATACARFEKRRLERTRYIITNSKRAGQIAQLQHPVLYKLRNAAFRHLPTAWTQFPLKRLLEEDFMAD